MTDETNPDKHCHPRRKIMGDNGAIYGMAFLGALLYYLHQATSFWAGVVGVVKAVFWPAVLLYKVLELLKM